MQPISEANQRVLTAITRHIRQHGYPPTLEDLCNITGISSKSTITGHLDRLAAAGAITRAPGVSRGIVIVDQEATAPQAGDTTS